MKLIPSILSLVMLPQLFLFASLLCLILPISRSAVPGVYVYGYVGGFLEKMLYEQDKPVAHSALSVGSCVREGIPKTRGGE